MKSRNCEQIQQRLLDYIEREMSSDERERVLEHLAQCDDCNKDYKGLRAMLNITKNLPVKDPGEEFWRQLPQKVLEEVRQRKKNPISNNVVDLASQRQLSKSGFAAPSFSAQAAPENYCSDYKNRRLTSVAAIAAILMLAVNVTMLRPKPSHPWLDQVKYQARIDTGEGLSKMAQTLALPLTDDTESSPLGFVEQHRIDKAYTVGFMLAATFAYLQDNQFSLALKQLHALQRQVQLPLRQSLQQPGPNTLVSAVTLSSVRKAIELLQLTDMKADNAKTQVDRLLVQFQGDYENFLTQARPRQLALYRAGIWVFNADLAVAARDSVGLTWPGLARELGYLREVFIKIKAPAGVQNSLREISRLVAQKPHGQASLSREDFRALQQALQNLNALLS